MFRQKGNKIQIQWTLAELEILRQADKMTFKGGYHLDEILEFLNKSLGHDKRRNLNIPKEVKEHGFIRND